MFFFIYFHICACDFFLALQKLVDNLVITHFATVCSQVSLCSAHIKYPLSPDPTLIASLLFSCFTCFILKKCHWSNLKRPHHL